MSSSGGSNLTWHPSEVAAEERRKAFGHGAACVWFTGLSGSGKSTVARALERRLVARGVHAYVLDGDNVRMGLNQDLGFSAEDRKENIRRLAELARLFVDSGAVVITAFISPYRSERALARDLLGERFLEVWVNPGIGVCEQRDPKGLYRRARAGEIADFTGISAAYEEPEHAELVIDTGRLGPEEAAEQVERELERRGTVAAPAAGEP